MLTTRNNFRRQIKMVVLEDLETLIENCRKNYNDLPYKGDIRIPVNMVEPLSSAIKNTLTIKDKVTVNAFSIELELGNGLKAYMPSSWLWIAYCFFPLKKALDTYQKTLTELKRFIKENKLLENDELNSFLKKIPFTKPEDALDVQDKLDKFESAISSYFYENSYSSEDIELFKKFIMTRNWWLKSVRTDNPSGKTLDRADAFSSAILLATGLVVDNSSKIINLIDAFQNDGINLATMFNKMQSTFAREEIESGKVEAINLADIFEADKNIHNKVLSTIRGENIIFYGAPGTGKSYTINKLTDDTNYVRTVFHPDTQYSDFVGCIKPSMNGDNIQYGFKAGPFTEALIKALQDPENHFFLVIEELNRAPAAAVFGDVFHLLDRNEHGESTYSVNVSDPDLLVYLKEHVSDFPENGELKIPANLSIYATMNSSDQAVMPLDTAFKRRWQFEYKKLDFSNSASGSLELNINGILTQVEWKVFAQAINTILSENSIPEDRHLGPWFISNSELAEPGKMKKTLTGKLFMYLWDDVLRHGRSNLIFNNDIRTYGALVTAYEKRESILSESLNERLKLLSEADTSIEQILENNE